MEKSAISHCQHGIVFLISQYFPPRFHCHSPLPSSDIMMIITAASMARASFFGIAPCLSPSFAAADYVSFHYAGFAASPRLFSASSD